MWLVWLLGRLERWTWGVWGFMGQPGGSGPRHGYNWSDGKRTDTGMCRDQQASMTDWMWVWKNNNKSRWLQSKTGKRDFSVCRNISTELALLCPALLFIWPHANSHHPDIQHVLAPSSMCSHPSIAGMSQLSDTSAAVIPCPVVFTSNPVIQGSCSQILPSTEETQVSWPRVAQMVVEFTVREIFSPRVTHILGVSRESNGPSGKDQRTERPRSLQWAD